MDIQCSFCGRKQEDAFTFFRSPDAPSSDASARVFICDRCVESCHRTLAAKKDYVIERVQKQRFRDWLNESVTETLVRAIVDVQYRDAFLATFAQRAELSEVDPAQPPQSAALALLPPAFVRQNRVVPWRMEDDALVVAFYNPLHMLDLYDEIAHLTGKLIRPALVPREEVVAAIERYVAAEP